jgi:hypothetical protein
MNYVIAVLPDRTQAETACSALEQEGFPTDRVSIVGKGYKTVDEFSFIDPKHPGRQRALLAALWLMPFGFIGGYGFNLSTGYELVHWAGSLGNHLVGGLLGAIGGAMGSFFIGGGFTLLSDSEDTPSYRKFLDAGKYLIVVNAPVNLSNKATSILRRFKPENLGYATLGS